MVEGRKDGGGSGGGGGGFEGRSWWWWEDRRSKEVKEKKGGEIGKVEEGAWPTWGTPAVAAMAWAVVIQGGGSGKE